MLPTIPKEAKRQLNKELAVCAIQTSLGGCKLAYLCVAIGRGLVSKRGRIWQNGTSHIAYSVIPSCANPNPDNLYGSWTLDP